MSYTYADLYARPSIIVQMRAGDKVPLVCAACGVEYQRPKMFVHTEMRDRVRQGYCSLECGRPAGALPRPRPERPRQPPAGEPPSPPQRPVFTYGMLRDDPRLLLPFRSRQPIQLRCKGCEQPYERPKNYIQSKLKRNQAPSDYCSQICEARSVGETIQSVCANGECGREFWGRKSEARLYCCQSCAAAVNNRLHPKRIAPTHPCPKCGGLVKPPNLYCDNFCFRVDAYDKRMERRTAAMRAEQENLWRLDHIAETHAMGVDRAARANRIVGNFFCEEVSD